MTITTVSRPKHENACTHEIKIIIEKKTFTNRFNKRQGLSENGNMISNKTSQITAQLEKAEQITDQEEKAKQITDSGGKIERIRVQGE